VSITKFSFAFLKVTSRIYRIAMAGRKMYAMKVALRLHSLLIELRCWFPKPLLLFQRPN
jgi:hypothetical protein